MKKQNVLLFAIIAGLAIAMTGCFLHGKKHVKESEPLQTRVNYNLDMETPGSNNMPERWIPRHPRDTTISVDSLMKICHTDTVVKQHGRSSILLERNGVLGWTVTKTIIDERFNGQKIKLTGYLKTEDVRGWAGLWFRIDGQDSVLAFDNMAKTAAKGTTDWTEYTIELNYDGKNAQHILAGAQIFGTGRAWVDNMHISIDGVDIATAKLLNN
ncbi:MAG: hypothetical protein JNM41_15895 [Flavipsychrobacter sp.]|nr:hypothetical protein [Flavipsychrobacter sp.]